MYWQIFCVTGEIFTFLKQICGNMATNLEPRDRIAVTVWGGDLVKTEVSVALAMILSMNYP